MRMDKNIYIQVIILVLIYFIFNKCTYKQIFFYEILLNFFIMEPDVYYGYISMICIYMCNIMSEHPKTPNSLKF